jgi:quercetin dioxygenase-like cupin family protein
MSQPGSMNQPGYEILSIDDLDRFPGAADGAPVLRPLRRRLGFQPFGVNCWTAPPGGGHVIERHFERDGDEELYVVLRGSATFTVGEETIEAPQGTLVHVLPGTLREAVTHDEDTVVLALGAKPGEAWVPAPWEDFHVAFATARSGDVAAARALIAQTLARHPRAWQGQYNAACFEALDGQTESAFAHLRNALALGPPEVREYARADGDLAGLHDDPRWAEGVG